MHLRSLRLENFRSYRLLETDFGPRGAFFFGPNGVGKTNILEAVHLLSGYRSFRGSATEPLVNWHAQQARIHGVYVDDSGIEHEAALEIDKKKRPS